MLPLDDYQLAAVTTTARHALVKAGPGAGKTRTLTARVGHVLDKGADPRRIHVATFTNAAARELERRTGRADLDHVGTFHSLFLRLVVRPYARQLGFEGSPAPADESEALSALRATALAYVADHPDCGIPTGRKLLEEWAARISLARNRLRRPSNPDRAAFLDAFQTYKLAHNLVDYDDMLLLPLRLMREKDWVRAEVAGAFDHVLVDEYQDTNAAQVELVRLLCSEGASLFAVGDVAQAIYAFRGADPGNVDRLVEVFPDLVTYDLPVSYRCPTRVLDLANRTGASDLTLVPSPPNRDRPGVVAYAHAPNTTVQGERVANYVRSLLAAGASPEHVAVLYRAHYVPTVTRLAVALRRQDVPFHQVGTRDLLAYKEVGALVDWATWVSEPVQHEASFLPVARWLSPHLGLGLGGTTLDKLVTEATRTGQPVVMALPFAGSKRDSKRGGERLAELVEEAQPHLGDGPHGFLRWSWKALDFDRWLVAGKREGDHAEELLAVAARVQDEGASLAQFLEGLALDAKDRDEAEVPSLVLLSTGHQAKGLEWDHVVVLAFDEGVWPAAKASSPAELAEERRLFYVAATRARESLTIVYSESHPSPLLEECRRRGAKT